jgi:hypothetical protein
MSKRDFTKQELLDILEEENESAEIVKDELVDTSRWSIIYDLIFRIDGKFYRTNYSVGATESQDEGPWEWFDYDSKIACEEVEPYEKTVIDYRAVK